MESFVEVASPVMMVKKRDGQTVQGFQREKIIRAVRAAWTSCRTTQDDVAIERVVQGVCRSLPEGSLDVEEIQNVVEVCLMRAGFHDVAKSYILYRHKRAEMRAVRQAVDRQAVADYVTLSKYSQYLPELLRRESYQEITDRVEVMHIKKFPKMAEQIRWAFQFVREKKVLPSMRTMQFGGKAVEAVNCRSFNCCATLIDRPRAFSEILYLLLCGSGVGFSVQYEHVDKLPRIGYVDENKVVHHTIADSIEGWAEALHALITSHIEGWYVEFDFSKIRPKGAALKTSGGKAPGHLGLKQALEKIREVLTGAAGRKLLPIECYDVLCHAADAVLSGGVRRSAMICMFSLEDSQMMHAKTGNWYPKHPWRQNSNNSVVILRGHTSEKLFKRIFEMTKEWGEPGFIFSNHPDYVFNPCVEAALHPVLTVSESNLAEAQRRIGQHVKVGNTFTGFSFCNLCSINAASVKSRADFEEAAKAATLIGTLQASYTSMPYLGGVTEMIAERDALLGVSMTGMLDKPEISCDPEIQRATALKIVEWNKEFAALLGIRSCARATVVKPEGTGSLAIGGVAPGHHAHHARRYIRRIVAKNDESIFRFLQSKNPHMCVKKPNGDYVIEFPVEAPPGAILKEDLKAVQFLKMVQSTQQNWVIPGTARSEDSPGLTHNVSNTVHVQDDEWGEVAEYLWDNQADFTAVSLMAVTGDKTHEYAPYMAITTEADEARWNQLIALYTPVDYTTMVEAEDGTNLSGEVSCAGGACVV